MLLGFVSYSALRRAGSPASSRRFHDAFDREFERLDAEVQDELLAHARLLERFGPTLGRPRVDTLKGSRHANMKELRFEAAGGA